MTNKPLDDEHVPNNWILAQGLEHILGHSLIDELVEMHPTFWSTWLGYSWLFTTDLLIYCEGVGRFHQLNSVK